jgi:hypothetical protein
MLDTRFEMAQLRIYKQSVGKTGRENSIEQSDGEIRLGLLYQSALSAILRTHRGRAKKLRRVLNK